MNYIKEAINKYGKKVVQELLDLIIIGQHQSRNDEADKQIRSILLKNKVIKSSTKIIRGWFSYYARFTPAQYRLRITNGRNQNILILAFNNAELPEIVALLND